MRKLWAFLLFSLFIISGLATVPEPIQAQADKWTFMVYMGADSSLEEFGIDDFYEMADVGTTDDVNIGVQFDRRPGGTSEHFDWNTTKRFLVQKDMVPDPSSAIADIGEVNMGDPQVLVNFTNWGMATYPAERYFLVLWGHGLGWRGVVQDSSSASDYLEPDELTWAFQAIVANNSGRKIDLVGADACRMTTELVYQLKDYVEFFVGSQKDEPEPGWPYDTILQNLTNDPDMGPAELGKLIADRYVDSYIDQTSLAVALSVIDSSRLEYLAEEVRRFVKQARSALPMFGDQFISARSNTEEYEGDSAYDLFDISSQILAEFANDPAPLRLEDVLWSTMNEVLSTVSYERNWDNPIASERTTNAHGLTIWYPLVVFPLTYHELDFSKATGWDDYLDDYGAVARGEVPDPGVEIEIDMSLHDTNVNGFPDTVQLEIESPENATLEVDVYQHSYTQIKTHSINLPENTPRFLNISLFEAAFVDLDLYLMNGTRIWLNNTLFRNVLDRGYTVSGFVYDKKGDALIGATVTIENVVSGETANVQSGISGYSVSVGTFSLNATNTTETIRVTAEYEDWSASTTFLMYYPPEEEIVNFVLGPEGRAESDGALLGILAVLLILETVLIIVLYILLRGKGREPLEKSGDELLKELELD